ncbi:MAG TPA: biotin/lipoyl-containing protein, partial [Candidatus Tectomicrobia bacterium]|nr:biotin/lipoyl-containing protein [Candidatus Tectomicrobia bacterium]
DGRYRVTIGDRAWDVDARMPAPGLASLLIDGVSHVAHVLDDGGRWAVEVDGETHAVQVEEQTRWIIRTRAGAASAAAGQTLTAPLPGKVARVAVAVGDRVAPGDTLVVIEAMKMENEFKATGAGTVTDVRARVGQAVNPGDVLVVIAG